MRSKVEMERTLGRQSVLIDKLRTENLVLAEKLRRFETASLPLPVVPQTGITEMDGGLPETPVAEEMPSEVEEVAAEVKAKRGKKGKAE